MPVAHAGRRDRCPFEPHSCALRPISPFPALLAGLAALRAANRRQIRETLEKPRSRAQLFKRFCALGTRRSFFPARENRSRAWARTRKQPRACAAGRRHKPGARLARRSRACVRGCFLLSFAFSCLAFASQNSFHLSLRPRRASTFFRKESRQRFAKGLGPFEPPCGQSFLLPRCWPAYAAFQAANRRLTGKRLKSPGAELSFSSVSVQRGTSAPFC